MSNYIQPREKENHVQKCLAKEHVSSQEGNLSFILNLYISTCFFVNLDILYHQLPLPKLDLWSSKGNVCQ